MKIIIFSKSALGILLTLASSLILAEEFIPKKYNIPIAKNDSSIFDTDEVVNVQPRIYNGLDVPNDTYPWFSLPVTTASYWDGCGASLISRQYVLTAAHCFFSNGVYNNDLGRYYVGTLCWDLSNCGQYEESHFVETTTIHPQYSQITLQNDFALVKLASPVSDSIEPVNIDDGSYSPQYATGKGNLWAIGFGLMENQSIPDRLQHVEVKYISNSDCMSDPYQYGFITEEMMCARDDENQDSCQGDSGGPLYDSEQNVLVGVTSWGIDCGVFEYPGVYARISSQFDWIKGVVCDGSSLDPSWCSSSPTTSSSPPTSSPTSRPSASPSAAPTSSPTSAPTPGPTPGPTKAPTKAPTSPPVSGPTSAPSKAATSSPTSTPTSAPTNKTSAPVASPVTNSPTLYPVASPILEDTRCIDFPDAIRWTKKKIVYCSQMTANRCSKTKGQSLCPISCGTTSSWCGENLRDARGRIEYGNTFKGCAFVRRIAEKVATRCSKGNVAIACRSTCQGQ